jgi:hypothetical protein
MQRLLALAAKAHMEAAMLNHRMAAIPGSSAACAALLVPLLVALALEDMAAWVDRVTATGSRGEAMDRIFAEGLADVPRRGWSKPAAKTAAATMCPPSSTFLPGSSFASDGGGGGGGAPGSNAAGALVQPNIIDCAVVANMEDA